MAGASLETGPVPVIETLRLRLRGHRLTDFAAYAEIWGDPAMVRHITGDPLGEEAAWARFLRSVGHWSLMGFGFWALEEKASGRFIGEAGFVNFKRRVEPPLPEAPEIGWLLAPWAQGRGHATEAVRAALAWGEDHFGTGRTVCMIHPDNAASFRVAEKCGFKEVTRARYLGGPTVVLDRELSG